MSVTSVLSGAICLRHRPEDLGGTFDQDRPGVAERPGIFLVRQRASCLQARPVSRLASPPGRADGVQPAAFG
jgi:hypothetical protein